SGEKRVFLVILFTSFSGSLVSRIPGAVQIAGSLFGMFLFSVITIVLPIVLRAHNKINRSND
ncbi:hypothetical protein, partial [Escherichia coli]|uniref:hypothetical protein n=1 Tax=Escherichia coli TaxID=562 RepID=UPI000BDEAA5F